MTNCRTNCACLYTESEYKDLIVEAHHHWRDPVKHDDNRYWFCCRYCGLRFKDKNRLSFHRYNDECEGWSGPYTLKMYPTFDKNDHAILKATLDERGLKFPSKYAGRGIKDFQKVEKSKVLDVVQTQVQLHSSKAGEDGAGGSRGRERKMIEEDNLSNIANAKKKRKITTRVDCEADGRDSGREILEKRGRDKKKKTSSPIIITSPEILIQMKKPLIRENLCGATEVDNQLTEKVPSPQLPQQTMPTCLPTKPDLQDKPTREDVEARARAYSLSFEVDVSNIPQVPKEVQTPGLYYLLSENRSSAIMDRGILRDPDKCIETLRVMEQNKTLEAAMKAAYFDWSVHDRKLVSLM